MRDLKLSEAVERFDWKLAPQFLSGDGVRDFHEIYQVESGGNEVLNRLTYDAQTKTLRGCSPLISFRVDTLVQPIGLRVAGLVDLYKPEIRAVLGGRFYSNPPTLVLRGSKSKGYELNTPLIEQLLPLVEEANGKIKFPLLVSGFDVQPLEGSKSYGLQIVKRKDFSASHSDKFRGENNRKRFTIMEQDGPKFNGNGNYMFYANDDATLAGLDVDSDGYLDSDSDSLDSSNDGGRVVLFPAEGDGAQKILNCKVES